MKSKTTAGHLCALTTVLIWGTTFISSKVLLRDLGTTDLILGRFVLALAALALIRPQLLRGTTWRQELTFAAAGATGVTFYFLLESAALTCTMAANVSVIVSLSPFFLALLARFVLKEKLLGLRFFLGFALAMTGIVLVSLNGARLQLDPLGDLMALGAGISWAVYSLLAKKIAGYGCHVILATRRVFFYGLLFMLPVVAWKGTGLTWAVLTKPVDLLNLLYLGLGASALCYVTWNWAVKTLGPVKTSVYVYLNPVITVLVSAVILPEEPVTVLTVLGTLLTLSGLALSESAGRGREEIEP